MSRPTAEIRLNLLGRFEALGTGVIAPLRARKSRALVTFLAFTHPEPQPRERLMALLWGSHFEAQARQNLRHAMVELRRCLGPDRIVSEQDLVGLRAQAIECDARLFRQLVDNGSSDALSAAVRLYRGDLAADLAIPERAWEEWLAPERESLRARCIEALVRLGEHALAAGDPAGALAYAGRALQLNEFREDAHRAQMSALAALGRRADALRHFESLAGRLESELAAAPEPSTRACAARIRGGESELPATRAASAAGEPVPETGAPSLAVLPFRTLSADPEIRFAADAFAHDLEVAFSKRGNLRVASLSLARLRPIGEPGEAAADLARPRDVTYVLEGSVRPMEDAVRINVLLGHAESGLNIWAESFEHATRDFLRGAAGTVEALVTTAHSRILSRHEDRAGEVDATRCRAAP